MPILEICANSIQSAAAAKVGGAHRIELCQNLESGGITPSIGLVAQVEHKLASLSSSRTSSSLRFPLHVLIRPRPGDFVYDDEEFEVMLADIRLLKELVDGFVVGVLRVMRDHGNNDHAGLYEVDVERLVTLVRVARPVPVTFHRAFDDCADVFRALDDIAYAGCIRILTSGGCGSAWEGREMLSVLVEKARKKGIVVMPGAGISSENVEKLHKVVRAAEYHSSAKKVIDDNDDNGSRDAQGNDEEGKEASERTTQEGRKSKKKSIFNASIWQTDVEEVERMVEIMKGL